MPSARSIKDHVGNPVNDKVEINTVDDPGPGGAHHHYILSVPDGFMVSIRFQDGPINEVGVNGITNEALLAVVMDRLRSFQAGPFSCRENALALTKCEEAMLWLHARTQERLRRGVEGFTRK